MAGTTSAPLCQLHPKLWQLEGKPAWFPGGDSLYSVSHRPKSPHVPALPEVQDRHVRHHWGTGLPPGGCAWTCTGPRGLWACPLLWLHFVEGIKSILGQML